MIFTSFQFFLFFPLLFLAHHWCCDRMRRPLILLASLGFYAAFWQPHLLVALAVVVTVTYLLGLRLGAAATTRRRKGFFWSGIIANIGVLIAVKYLPAIFAGLNIVAGWLPLPLSFTDRPVLVSIGVSYFVFQAISYLIDIYLEIIEPERDFGVFAIYLSFFPKLLQGPIERAGDLLPQLHAPYRFDYHMVRSGLLLFAWGMFEKLVVADRLAIYVDMVYGNVRGNTSLALICATWLYAFQIFFDFAGYTDMALGLGRLFNIRLTQNFNAPYLATSIADFWRRWHISFSRWILDYIFKPLQMKWRNHGTAGTVTALVVTFFVSGVWHGATWGFVIWGLLHGLYLGASVIVKPYQKKVHSVLGIKGTLFLKVWQTIVTFNLVCLAWVFFRAGTFSDAWYVVTHTVIDSGSALIHGSIVDLKDLGVGRTKLYQSFLPMVATLGVFLLKDRIDFFARPRWLRWTAYYLLVYLILFHGITSDKPQFVYFQF